MTHLAIFTAGRSPDKSLRPPQDGCKVAFTFSSCRHRRRPHRSVPFRPHRSVSFRPHRDDCRQVITPAAITLYNPKQRSKVTKSLSGKTLPLSYLRSSRLANRYQSQMEPNTVQPRLAAGRDSRKTIRLFLQICYYRFCGTWRHPPLPSSLFLENAFFASNGTSLRQTTAFFFFVNSHPTHKESAHFV